MNVNRNRLTKILTLNVSSGWYFVKDNKHFFNFFKKTKQNRVSKCRINIMI